ncbi:MAG: DUF5721 family protein [Clostridiales bacterium]|jgi:hypothetical protein|nr:DUF5721 family protein [Clostridiales bacterium]
MLVFEIKGEAVKSVMNQLLKGVAFDGFLVRGIEICTITKFEISGILDKSFLSGNQSDLSGRNFCLWSELKPYAFGLIKGSKKPKSIKIVFSLPDSQAQAIHENAAAMFLNLSFEEEKLILSAAASQKNFSLDKTMLLMWEGRVRDFFKDNGWPVSTLSQ